MPKRSTDISIGFNYHIYNRAVAGNLLFLDQENYKFFLSKIEKYLSPIGDILAYCLMPNHYHILFQLNQISLSEAMQKLALSYTVPFNTQNSRSGHLFQGRYQLKHVKDIQYLIHLSRYIHLNPQVAGLEKHAENWKYSSLNEYYGNIKYPLSNPNIILELFSDTAALDDEQKRQEYRKFIDEWNPEYMVFKQK